MEVKTLGTLQEELCDTARRFALIYEAKEYGLMTWHDACGQLYRELKQRIEAIETQHEMTQT